MSGESERTDLGMLRGQRTDLDMLRVRGQTLIC